jgi:tRNA A37 threonylcarbamoyladenosine dehydratase
MTVSHRFSRLELLVGRDGLARLEQSSVAVFGLGGVGSFAAEALVRGGVGRLTLIDFDSIDITNLNRQLHALDGTVGRAKAQVMAERCRAINPAAQVEALQAFYAADSSAELLGRGYDYVLDCIDHISAKLHLIETCLAQGLPVISSMGAANKVDPTQVRVADLAQTRTCRLARIIRRELRRRGIDGGLKVVYSTEEFRPLGGGRPASDEDDGPARYQTRRAPLGSSSVIPPLFGLTMAGEVLRALLGASPDQIS